MEKSGASQRRRSTKDRIVTGEPVAPVVAAAAAKTENKLIEAEKAETGKVLHFFVWLFLHFKF